MYYSIQILSDQWYRTLPTHDITWVCCELNGLSREYITRSHVNLNKVVLCGKISLMLKMCHWRYYVDLLISKYLSYSWQVTLAIDRTDISMLDFVDFLNEYMSNISNIYNPNVTLSSVSQTKCDNMFSYPKSDHIFSYFSVMYLIYIFFLFICGNYPLT